MIQIPFDSNEWDAEERQALENLVAHLNAHPAALEHVRSICSRLCGPELDAVLLDWDQAHDNQNNNT